MILFHGTTSARIPVLQRIAIQVLTLFLLLAPSALSAQTGSDLFRGTWQIETPEKGALVIILKPQGLASYFFGDNTDRTVYQGSWSHTDSAATIRWQDGSSHLIERSASGYTATAQNPSGANIYRSPAAQLPQEILGQWAKPPTREDEMRSDRDQAKGYFGIWKIGDAGKFIFVEPDRSAASTSGNDADGQRGEWAKQGSELHIIWDNGDYGILRETERGYTYKQVPTGAIIEDDESETQSAVRTIETKIPANWLAAYETERTDDSGGLAFTSGKVARAFYRGNWLINRGGNNFEQVELARFGGLATSADRSLDGQWTMSGQDVFMRWDDGMRKILSPVGRGFVLYEYKPGRPLDGVPSRVLAAAPANPGKLAEHLKGRKDVARQMQEMAQAAGIDPSAQEGIGWGRTFARWVWPFGGDVDATSTEAMLAEEFEPAENADPWWWPFWSEKPEPEPEASEPEPGSEAAPEEDAPEAEVLAAIEAPEENSESTDAEVTEEADLEKPEEAPAPKKHRDARDWLWPF